MRTRHSPRNQARLWQALGGAMNPAPRRRERLPSRAEARARMVTLPVTQPAQAEEEDDQGYQAQEGHA